MPFEPGHIPEGATPFKEGQSGNPAGKIPGTKNRSTIARKILEMRALFKADTFDKLKKLYPDITNESTAEEIMTIIHVHNAIEGDDKSYKAVMDSAYGSPKQEMETTINGGLNIHMSREEIKQIAKDLEDQV